MTNDPKSINPRSLDAEERAIVDRMAFDWQKRDTGLTWAAAYERALFDGEPILSVRRSAFAAPQPETVGTVETTADRISADLAAGTFRGVSPKPAPCPTPEAGAASEMPDSGRIHELKCWRGPFAELLAGRKTFEYRQDDRRFEIGDSLVLRQFDADTGTYTSERINTIQARVTHILRGPSFGCPEGFVVMSLGGISSDDGPIGSQPAKPASVIDTEALREEAWAAARARCLGQVGGVFVEGYCAAVRDRLQASQPVEAKRVRLPETMNVVDLLLWKINNGQGEISVKHYDSMLKDVWAELKREGIEG